MRVAINGWFLDQLGTGSGQYLRGLLTFLPALARGDEFLLVVPARPVALSIPGLQIQFWTAGARFSQGDVGKVLFEQVAFPLACRRWRADIAHVPYWGSPWWPPVPTVVTIHDLIPMLLPVYQGGPLVRLYTRLVATSARRAAVVLADSLASQRDVEQGLRLPAERVRCIYLGADPSFTPEPSPDDEKIRGGYFVDRLESLSHYVLYLAGHDVRKNVAGLLNAFAIVAGSDDRVTLVVGGKLPEQVPRRSLLRGTPPLFDPRPMVAELGLTDRVHFIGWVDPAHKAALYRGAACAVFPSRYEGFGFPVLEALACGTPLVTSNAGSLPELLGDAGYALDPDDVNGMAGAILSCLRDESLAAELRQRGPAQAAKFRWGQTARETLDAYRAALLPRHQATSQDS